MNWICKECDYTIDEFDLVNKHCNDKSHEMKVNKKL